MSKESFGKALEAMVNDGDAASALTSGDFEQLGDHGFTPAEQALLQAAAGDMPDVSGFSNQFLKVDYIGETEKNYIKLSDVVVEFGPRFREAADYYRYELTN